MASGLFGIENYAAKSVYLMRGGDFLKVGIADNVEARHRAIRAMCPLPLELVAVIQGGKGYDAWVSERPMAREKAIHRTLKDLGVHVHGAWSKATDAALRLLSVDFNLEE